MECCWLIGACCVVDLTTAIVSEVTQRNGKNLMPILLVKRNKLRTSKICKFSVDAIVINF